MESKYYDMKDPGPPGAYKWHLKGDARSFYRKWDGYRWYMSAYDLTIEQALAKRGSISVPGHSDRDASIVYVCDLDANLIEPREARFQGDPPWSTWYKPKQEQLELF